MPHAPLARNDIPCLPLRALALVECLGLCACFSEYHPEYHPETSYSVVQRVEYTTAVVTPAGSSRSSSPALPVEPSPPPSPPPAPSASVPVPTRGTASLAGEWVERVRGTTCDRRVSIEEVDGVPYAKVRGCHGSDTEDELRTLDARGGGLRARRQDPHDSETLDYRLARAGLDELRGTVERRDRSSSGKPTTYPVVWRRGGEDTAAPTGPYAAFAGLWSESLDEIDKEGQPRGQWGRECDDEIAIEVGAKGVRAYDHFCYSGHFDNSVLTLVGEEEGTLRFRLEGSARYGTVDYLLRNVGGRLQGFVVYNPAPGKEGAKPSHRGVTWSRR
jgi:hypothetical protein